MESLTHEEVTLMLFSLAVLLGTARALGEIAQWLRQPAVVGEMLAGVLLGPTVFGRLAPDWQMQLFPDQGHVAVFFSGMTTLAITLFLLVAGMEVDLSMAWKQGSAALKVSLLGTIVPFILGLSLAWYLPEMMGAESHIDRLIFSLFIATALSISALPVIAKTLIDLGMYRSDLGMVIISSAVINDLVGWLVFAVVLGMMGHSETDGSQLAMTISLILAFAIFMMTIARWSIHKILPYIKAYTHWPGGILAFCFTLTLLGASFTEWIGVHGIFGAFLVGVAIGDSSHLRERTRATIDHFVSFIFAPLFFGSIGLYVNFGDHFNGTLIFTVLVVACVGKLIGCLMGGWWAGFNWSNSCTIAAGMNARGAMEIILGLLALKAGVIQKELFVALVVMALVTSMASGPLMQMFLRQRKARNITHYLSSSRFIRNLTGITRDQVLEEMAVFASSELKLDPEATTSLVVSREQIMPTGIGQGIAVPHARLGSLQHPAVILGISRNGIDFNAPDDLPVHLVFLILTPENDYEDQLEIMESIAHAVRSPRTVEQIYRASSMTEIIAIFKGNLHGH